MKEGKTDYIHIGNNLAVDFINTHIVDRGVSVDLLESVADLARWVNETDLNVPTNLEYSSNLSSVKELRSAIKKLFVSSFNHDPVPVAELATLNRWLPRGHVEQCLSDVGGAFVLSPVRTELTIERLLGRIAVEAATLLSSSHLSKLKCCANPSCVLLFLDVSRSGKRRWCSMELCGNRAKAATYYSSVKN